jgi:8-oxo-dGTP diphosphatase
MSPERTPVDVAVGVLVREDGRFLLASRPDGKPYPGYWEFPGGKLERGESVAAALKRELHEELAIDIGAAHPWVVREFDYPHARVRLHFCRVFEWSGELHPREEQQYGFFAVDQLPTGPLLPATVPVLRWLRLPPFYAISAASRLGRAEFLRRLEAALGRGMQMLQLREPDLDAEDFGALFDDVSTRVRAAGAMLMVNSRHGRRWWDRADGVHLTSADLREIRARPAATWVGASIHDTQELQRCAELGIDFAVAGPVHPTTTHPGQPALGWNAFAALIESTAVPIYAIGGLQPGDLPAAVQRGAHGVALLTAAWTGQPFGRAGSSGAAPVSSAIAPGIE